MAAMFEFCLLFIKLHVSLSVGIDVAYLLFCDTIHYFIDSSIRPFILVYVSQSYKLCNHFNNS